MSTDHRLRHRGRPVPDVAVAGRLGRDEPRPRLLRRLRACCAPTPTTACEGHGFVFTIGRGNDVAGRGDRGAARRTSSGRDVEELLADMGGTWRELVHDSQLRWLGPEKGVMHMAIGAVVNALWDLHGQARRSAAVAAAVRADARGARRPGRLPLPHRRADPRRGAGDPARGRARPGRARATSCSPTATRPTPPRPAGWATTTTSSRGCAGRPSPTASPRSSSRSAPTSTTTSAGCASPATPSAPTSRIAVDANQRWDVDEAIDVGRARWRRSTSPGSRSRRAPTTSSATPPSRARIAPDPGRDRRAHGQPRHVQAVPAGRRAAGPADRRHPGRRGQREHRDPAARGQVRRAGLPARRRRRAVRGGPAPGDVRLRRRLGHARGPDDRVRRPPARALRHAGRVDDGRYLAPTAPGAGHRDAGGLRRRAYRVRRRADRCTLPELGRAAPRRRQPLPAMSDERRRGPARRPPGTAASAPSTPRPTTGSACRSGGSARSCRPSRATSSSSRPRSAGCCAEPGRRRPARDDEGFAVPAPTCAACGTSARRASARSLEESLARLGLDRVDVALPARPRGARPRRPRSRVRARPRCAGCARRAWSTPIGIGSKSTVGACWPRRAPGPSTSSWWPAATPCWSSRGRASCSRCAPSAASAWSSRRVFNSGLLATDAPTRRALRVRRRARRRAGAGRAASTAAAPARRAAPDRRTAVPAARPGRRARSSSARRHPQQVRQNVGQHGRADPARPCGASCELGRAGGAAAAPRRSTPTCTCGT